MDLDLLHRKLVQWNMRVVVCADARQSFPRTEATEDLSGLQDSQVSWVRRTLLIEQRVFRPPQIVHELAHIAYPLPIRTMPNEYRGWFYLLERWYARQLQSYAEVYRSFAYTARLPWSPTYDRGLGLTTWAQLNKSSRDLWTAYWRRSAKRAGVLKGRVVRLPLAWRGQEVLGARAGLYWLGPAKPKELVKRAGVWCPR